MKKILSLLFTIMLLSMTTAFANSPFVSGIFEYIVEDDMIKIVSCTDYDSEIITIPSTIEGKPVVSVGGFIGNERNVKEIILPEGIKEISEMAFYYCESLEKINFPSSLEKIGKSAFYNCSNLNNIHLPKNLSSIGSDGVFRNCFSLNTLTVDGDNQYFSADNNILYNKTKSKLVIYPAGKSDVSFVVPNTVVEIGENAFYNCDTLTEIILSESVEIIGEAAIFYCDGIESIHIPEKVRTIGEVPFGVCDNLREITIDENNEFFSVEDGMLMNFDKTEILFYIPNSNGVLVIPNNIIKVANSAFRYSNIETIIIPSSVSYVGKQAFFNSDVEKVYISNESLEIDENVFDACYNLNTIYYCGSESQWNSIIADNIENEYLQNATIVFDYDNNIIDGGNCGKSLSWLFYNDGTLYIKGTGIMYNYDCLANWGNTAPWYDSYGTEIRKIIIEEGVTSIGEGAFSNCYYLNNVSLPSTLQTIGDYAFYGIYDLKAIQIPENVSHIGIEVFSMCRDMEFVTVSQNNSTYANDANGVLYSKNMEILYYYPLNNPLESYTTHPKTKHIEYRAFHNCDNFISIQLNDTLETIDESAFEYADGLKAIHIPATVYNIGDMAFSGCESLTEITVDDKNSNYKSEDGILYNSEMTRLICFPAGISRDEYTVKNGVTIIDHGAFKSSDILKITLPEGLEKIESYAFEYCMDLSSVYLPSSLKFIGHDAFFNAIDLDCVFIPKNVEMIDYRAFYHLDGVVFWEGNAPTISENRVFNEKPLMCCRSNTTGWEDELWNDYNIHYTVDDIAVINKINTYKNSYVVESYYAPFTENVLGKDLNIHYALYDNDIFKQLQTKDYDLSTKIAKKNVLEYDNTLIKDGSLLKTFIWDDNIRPYIDVVQATFK